MSLESMLGHAKQFCRWGDKKRYLFAYGSKGETGFPNSDNMTRVSQLASQLYNHIAFWLGIAKDPEALRIRIGSPQGEHTAAMRRSLLPKPEGEAAKDRQGHTHHREDAALLACMPPTGLNVMHYKGIFYCKYVPWVDPKDQQMKRRRSRFALTAEDGLPVPDIQAFLESDDSCPVVKKRSSSKYRSLGDSTFWRMDEEGHTWQRTPLDPTKMKSAEDVLYALKACGIRNELIPSLKEIDTWLLKRTAALKGENPEPIPLRLTNGVPVKSVWKKDGKGSLVNSPMGWSGVPNKNGKLMQLRSLVASNDRLEIWIGWNPKKKCWEYQKRMIPTREALIGIKRMGLPWRKSKKMPEYLRALLEREKASSLRDLICGTLHPHSVHVASVRKGDVVKTLFEYDPKFCTEEKKGLKEEMWGSVSALLTSGCVFFKSLMRKDTKVATSTDVKKTAALFGYPSDPEAYARQHGLTHP